MLANKQVDKTRNYLINQIKCIKWHIINIKNSRKFRYIIICDMKDHILKQISHLQIKYMIYVLHY